MTKKLVGYNVDCATGKKRSVYMYVVFLEIWMILLNAIVKYCDNDVSASDVPLVCSHDVHVQSRATVLQLPTAISRFTDHLQFYSIHTQPFSGASSQ